jgi:hypothetical protein
MVGVMAAPVVYLIVGPIVFRSWPPACQAPDGSTLLCLITDQYARPRDLTAAALSLVIGLVATAGIFLWTTPRRSTARRPSRAPMR